MDRKIDFNSLVTDPIAHFSEYINANLAEAIDRYFEQKWATIPGGKSLINELTQQIDDAKQWLSQRKHELKIAPRMIVNRVLMITFFLVIGLPLLFLYLANRRVIKDFQRQSRERQGVVQELINQRFEAISQLFATTTFQEAVSFIFQNFGILPNDDWSFLGLNQMLSDRYRRMVDCSGFSGIIKNSPFYDVIVREHNVRNVTSAVTMSFPYMRYQPSLGSTTVMSPPLISEEILTARHVEATPFLDEQNLLIYMTNFNPSLAFTTNNSKMDHGILLENREFIQDYRLVDQSKDPLKLAEFFTIRAQENFVNWYKHEKGKVHPFSKWLNQLSVMNSEHNLPRCWSTNDPISILDIILANPKNDLNQCLEYFKAMLRDYFVRLVKMLQIPLLVPGISREWYQPNGEYLIASQDRSMQSSFEPKSGQEIASKFVNYALLTFKSTKVLKRKPWLSLISSQRKTRCTIYRFNWNSYWSELLVDQVSVVGVNVGTRIIPVTYEKFHQVQESKIIFVGLPLGWKNVLMISHIKLRSMIAEQAYQNQALFVDFIKKNNVWTNNPATLETKMTAQVKNFFELLRQINEKYQLDMIVHMDNSGTYLIINDPTNYSAEVEETIMNIFPSKWVS